MPIDSLLVPRTKSSLGLQSLERSALESLERSALDAARPDLTYQDLYQPPSSQLIMARGTTAVKAPEPPPPNDDILFIGMNASARHEAEQLQRNARGKVTFIGETERNDQITVNGRTYDLSTRAGIDDFTRTLGLPEEQRRRVADAIEHTGPGARDEMAQLAQVWARGERGGSVPSRMVLSGHSTGDGVWGENNGQLSMENIRELARAMPRAAGRVEDLHIAGCYSGGKHGLAQWKEIFPNAKTIWAYGDKAPGSYSGAAPHLIRWERATRGRATDLDPAVARGTRFGENVDTWSERGGYRTRDDRSLPDLLREYESSRADAERYLQGEREVEDPYHGPLRDHYGRIQRLLGNQSLSPEDRARLEVERDRVVRMLFYKKTIAPNFQKNYGDAIAAAYRALRLEPPEYGKLSRAEALRQIAELEARAGSNPSPAVKRALELLRGLRDLDPKIIPSRWIGAIIQLSSERTPLPPHFRLGR